VVVKTPPTALTVLLSDGTALPQNGTVKVFQLSIGAMYKAIESLKFPVALITLKKTGPFGVELGVKFRVTLEALAAPTIEKWGAAFADKDQVALVRAGGLLEQ
jgi:hypothetical protein